MERPHVSAASKKRHRNSLFHMGRRLDFVLGRLGKEPELLRQPCRSFAHVYRIGRAWAYTWRDGVADEASRKVLIRSGQRSGQTI
jgi:hypothetical protein